MGSLRTSANLYPNCRTIEVIKAAINHVKYLLFEHLIYKKSIFRVYHHIVNRRGTISPYPFKLICVNPDDIKYCSTRENAVNQRWKSIGRVLSGEWDLNSNSERLPFYMSAKFCDSLLYQSFHNHFDHGIEWTETEFYEECIERLKNDPDIYRNEVRSPEDLLIRLREMDKLYESINKKGYESQEEIVTSGSNNIIDNFKTRHNEVMVDIDRDGNLLFVNGRHRLIIAKLLSVDKIPALTVVRHKNWNKIRTTFHEAESHDEIPTKYLKYSSHPDIKSVF